MDASALLSGKPPPLARLIVPASVLGEVRKRGRDQRAVEYLSDTGRLDVREPSPQARARARDAAARTGDAARLSPADLDVVALALDLGARTATDDYSIQNVCTALGVAFVPMLQPGIREVIEWTYRCIGCRRTFETETKECPVCGSPVKSGRGPGLRTPK